MKDAQINIKDVPIYMKNTLRSLRIKFGYTQKKAAELLEISPPTLLSWERDSGRLSYYEIEKVEEVYKISADFIYFGEEVAFSKLLRSYDNRNTA